MMYLRAMRLKSLNFSTYAVRLLLILAQGLTFFKKQSFPKDIIQGVRSVLLQESATQGIVNGLHSMCMNSTSLHFGESIFNWDSNLEAILSIKKDF